MQGNQINIRPISDGWLTLQEAEREANKSGKSIVKYTKEVKDESGRIIGFEGVTYRTYK